MLASAPRHERRPDDSDLLFDEAAERFITFLRGRSREMT